MKNRETVKKKLRDVLYSFMLVGGFLLVCCDAPTGNQLAAVILLGFGLLGLGGSGLMKNNPKNGG